MKLSEVVRELIRLGDASRLYWDRELPRYHPRYPIIRDGEESPPAPPEDAQIEAILRSLSEDQLYTILVLNDVGPGRYRVNDLPASYRTMKDYYPTSDLAIAKMVESYGLSENLADSVDELQKRSIDLDSLHFAGIAAAS